MSSPEFDSTIQQAAAELYQAGADAYANVYAGAQLDQVNFGLYFTVVSGAVNPLSAPETLLTQPAEINYNSIPYSREKSGINPALTFIYDGLGNLESFEFYTDNNTYNQDVFTIYKADDDLYYEDFTKLEDEGHAEVALFRLELPQADAALGIDEPRPNENAVANYLLEKEMLQSGHQIAPERVQALLPILRQAIADLTYA